MNFGSNLRKFLEVYTYYFFPEGPMLSDRFKHLIKDPLLYEEVNRVINENSHLNGRLEHGMCTPKQAYINDIALKVLQVLHANSEKQLLSLLKAVERDENKRNQLISTLENQLELT